MKKVYANSFTCRIERKLPSIRKKMSCLSRDGIERFWEEAAKIFRKEYETCYKKEDNL